MVGKLVSAEFCGKSAVELQVVVDAFCAAFPSLQGLRAQDLLDFMASEGSGRQAGARIEEVLEEASWNGEWSGRVYRILEHDAGHKPSCIELVVQPWVGDRVLRITDARETRIWPQWIAKADYSKRPSGRAAGSVVELVKLAEQMGGPMIRVRTNERAQEEYKALQAELVGYGDVACKHGRGREIVRRLRQLKPSLSTEEDVCLCLFGEPEWDSAYKAYAEFVDLAHELHELDEVNVQTTSRGCEIATRMDELNSVIRPKEDK